MGWKARASGAPAPGGGRALAAALAGVLAVTGGAAASRPFEWRIDADGLVGRYATVGPIAVRLAMDPAGGAQLRVAPGRIDLAEPVGARIEVPPLLATCHRPTFEGGQVRCAHAQLAVEGTPSRGSASFSLGPRGLAIRLEEAVLDVFGGRVTLDLDLRPGAATKADVRIEGLALPALVRDPAGRWEVTRGRLSGRVRATLAAAGGPEDVEWSLTASGVDFSSASGVYAAEGLAGGVRGRLTGTAQGLRLQGSAGVGAGAVAAGATVIDAGATPLGVSVQGTYRRRARRAQWQAELRHAGVARGTARGEVSFAGSPVLTSLDATVDEADVHALYASYLRGVAIGTPFESLATGGALRGRLSWRRGGEAGVVLDLDRVHVEDAGGRFALAGLSGTVAWSGADRASVAGRTRLEWAGGSLLRVPVGAGALTGTLWGRRFELERPLRIPLLDGRLDIRSLQASGIGGALAWRVEAALRPVSMEAVSEAFGWPSFGGTVSGELPGMVFRDGSLALDGSVALRLLGGEVRVTDLTLHEPFGVIPRLNAEVTVRGLSLEALTRAFSFGRILGRLDGKIRGLELVDWRPTAFDARFFTPPDDDSPHRISQRAVDTLAQLGGGPTRLLSTTFLRFFEEFSYRDLGLRCRLRNGVCEMDGIGEDTDGGYFIVRGRGIPRISVKGYNRRVDWAVLVQRLRDAIRSGAPTVR